MVSVALPFLQCLCQDVPYATVQRSQILQAAADMLPAEVQAAHTADIVGRHHEEALQPHVLQQVLQQSSLELPDAATMHYAPTGAELVAFFAGPDLEKSCVGSMPHVMTFHQYWQQMLKGSCQAPHLAPQASITRPS